MNDFVTVSRLHLSLSSSLLYILKRVFIVETDLEVCLSGVIMHSIKVLCMDDRVTYMYVCNVIVLHAF